ncbi:hypothetical protein V0M98_32105 (plasmid) [Pseudomonas silesiensis]|uniref:hypothetical protein n=1 Tax=Pseudomonas silesiensis TaxID=1853130 RepID=UPI0030CCF0F4
MVALYRLIWIALMILVIAPAFIFAISVDGITHTEAQMLVWGYMRSELPFPDAMVGYLVPPVTFVAQLLPASASIPVLAGEMIWEHIGVIFTFIFFASVRPPVFSWMISKTDMEANELLLGK